nr:hypothetical protein [Corynebacterium lactis]
MSDNTPDHISVSPAALRSLSRDYQNVSHRVAGLATLVSGAPERCGLPASLDGSRLAPSIAATCARWEASFSSSARAIMGLAFAADSLADAAAAHQSEQSRAFGHGFAGRVRADR